jgi:hypothetical protein
VGPPLILRQDQDVASGPVVPGIVQKLRTARRKPQEPRTNEAPKNKFKKASPFGALGLEFGPLLVLGSWSFLPGV